MCNTVGMSQTRPSVGVRPLCSRLGVGAALAAVSLAASAQATWSIILINTRTGEVAVGSATCLTGFDLRANTPVLLTGIGGATAQSAVDSDGANRVFIRDRMLMGLSPGEIFAALAGFDGAHQSRQYGLCDTRFGGRVGTFTGSGAGQWAGGITGRGVAIGHAGADIVYAIQGNVLTGAPVVQMAESAVLTTPGDLAAKLMASMEAARAMGGDGRCSCSQSNPTACGAPPATFTKSAHIAYMLIARTGDRDGCNGIYRTQSTPFVCRAADLNGDGRPELLSINAGASSVSVFPNISTAPGQGALGVAVNYSGMLTPRDVVVGDVTGDGVPDVVVAASAGDRVSVLPGLVNSKGQATGLFGAPVHLAVGTSPYGVTTGDFNRDSIVDIAACNSASNTLSVMLGTGGGAFAPAVTIPCLVNPQAIGAADLDGDGDVDIVLGSAGTAGVQIVRNQTVIGGSLSLITETAIPGGGSGIAQLRIGDVSGDGRPDIVTASGGNNSIALLLADGAGGYTPQVLAFGPVPGGVAIGDVSGDGIADIVGVTRSGTASRLGVLRGLGGGSFAAPVFVSLPNTPGRIDLADIDQDGDLDAMVPMQTMASMLVINNIGGIFNDGVGCATGDYYMAFNIANQNAAAQDPVLQLQTRYNAWRTGLIGKPDAERSEATLTRPVTPNAGDGTCVQTLTIRLRDWQGSAVSAMPGTVSVFHAPGSAARAVISAAAVAPDGTVSVTITSPFPGPEQTGADAIAVRIEPTGPVTETNRAVTLMPFVRLARAPHADINLDGVRGVPDIFAFLSVWYAGAQGADYDASGMVDSADVFAFLDRWFRAG